MCLAMPAQILDVRGTWAKAGLPGATREIDVTLVESVTVGDWVLVHAGFAIQKLAEDDARETLRTLAEMNEVSRELPAG